MSGNKEFVEPKDDGENWMQDCLRYPHKSLDNANMYAIMTGQAETWKPLYVAIETAADLGISLMESGLIPVEISGLGLLGYEVQAYAEAHCGDDVRFSQFLEATKARFLVDIVTDDAANQEIEAHTKAHGHSGSLGMMATASAREASTKN